MNAKEFQNNLHDLAFDLGRESDRLFRESYGRDWPDEESTTGALFGALVQSARGLTEKKHGIRLRVQFTKKKDEAEHGADVFVKFKCNEPHWKIDTTTVIQAKRIEPSRAMGSGDHERLMGQLNKMLLYTTESFILIYSSENGIQALSAVAARSLCSRQPFDADTISWPWFLSAIFRGRLGEPDHSRLPSRPQFEIEIVAEAARGATTSGAMTAGG